MKTAFACLAVIAALLPTFAHAKEPNWAECKPYCVQEAGATKGVVVSGSNQQLLEVSVITPQAANAAFAQIKADKRIPFAFLLDGAYARSFAIGKQLGDRGIATAQAVVDGKLQFMSEEFGAIDWGYHIAPAVLIREKASIKLYVLDPSLTSGPVTYEEWRAIFLKTRVTKITDQYLVSRFVYGPEKTDTSTEYDPEALADMDETNQKYTELMAQVRAAQDEQADDAKHAPSAPKEVKSFRDCTDCPEMVVIPAGRFQMGSPDSEPGRYNDEGPVHTVNLKSFALAKTEVTQKQWRAIMGSYTGKFGDCGDDCPADGISWSEAQAFVKKLSERTGETYRLPSEAEWEYSARAGTTGPYWWGTTASHDYLNYGTDACCEGLASGKDHWKTLAPVASFPANPFGLYDMNGNVYEWAEDCYHKTYDGAPTDGSAWDVAGCSDRVMRGGDWFKEPRGTRNAMRGLNVPTFKGIGFRVAKSLGH
jgi:formylglycine-generating enzyme required for sulfatase activity